MPTTNYPKSYILERIAARRASLQSKRNQATKAIDEATATIVQGQVRLADTLQKEYEAAAAKAAEATISSTDIAYNVRVLNALNPKNLNIDDPFEHRWGSRIEQSPERMAAQSADNARLQIKELDKEIDALNHTEAYLKETPVEEFSLTSLKRLGLMEAIRFNLDDAVKATSK